MVTAVYSKFTIKNHLIISEKHLPFTLKLTFNKKIFVYICVLEEHHRTLNSNHRNL